MSTTEVNRFISPYDDPAPGGRGGVGGALPLLPALPRGPPRVRGEPVLVRRPSALAHRVQAVRHDHGRVRDQVPGAVQHAPPADPAGQRHRLPGPQRLRLHEPGSGSRGADPRARAAVPGTGGSLLRQLGLTAGELGAEDPPRDRRSGGARVRSAAGGRAVGVDQGGPRPGQHVRADARTTTGRSSWPTRRSSTTSSSSTSATSPTSTSSPSARRHCPASPTSASRRWCRASTSSCSVRTRSCASSLVWPSSSASPTP